MVEIVHNFEIRVYFLAISNSAISFRHHIKNISLLPFLISPEMEPSQILVFTVIEKQNWKLLNYSVAHGKKFSSIFPFCVIFTGLLGPRILKHYLSVKPMEMSWILMRTVPVK